MPEPPQPRADGARHRLADELARRHTPARRSWLARLWGAPDDKPGDFPGALALAEVDAVLDEELSVDEPHVGQASGVVDGPA